VALTFAYTPPPRLQFASKLAVGGARELPLVNAGQAGNDGRAARGLGVGQRDGLSILAIVTMSSAFLRLGGLDVGIGRGGPAAVR